MSEQQYLAALTNILAYGSPRDDRTGVGTISNFVTHMSFDLRESFPLLTTKRVFWNGVVDELLWFLSGSTNVNDLPERSRQLWSPWADEYGDLGPVYGCQWRFSGWSNRDQIANVIESIKLDPHGRRHIVSAWNPSDIDKMALPPCHILFQFYVTNDNELSCHLYQRSGDMFLGVPFNIASYSLLTYMIALVCGLKPGYFHHTIGDAHIYMNHIEQVQEQLSRTPTDPPTLWLDPNVTDIDEFEAEHIKILGYNPAPAIKAPVAV